MMLLEVFSGAFIMFVGIVTGWASCNVAHKKSKSTSADTDVYKAR